MKTSAIQAGHFRPVISKIVTTLAVAAAMGSMVMTPAFADNDHREKNQRQVHRDNGRHNGEWRNNRRGPAQTYYYTQPYYYAPPVYVPPPVYYAPQRSPGISFFIPLNIRR